MTPQAFSNAMVATVGGYAEVVAEQAQMIEQLQAALRQPRRPALVAATAVIEQARRLVARFDEGGAEMKVSAGLGALLVDLTAALAAFDKAGS